MNGILGELEYQLEAESWGQQEMGLTYTYKIREGGALGGRWGASENTDGRNLNDWVTGFWNMRVDKSETLYIADSIKVCLITLLGKPMTSLPWVWKQSTTTLEYIKLNSWNVLALKIDLRILYQSMKNS